jgi:hypothetical protein
LRIDHVPIKGALLGVWQAAFRRVLDFKEINHPFLHVLPERTYEVKTIKFVVKLNRGGRGHPSDYRTMPNQNDRELAGMHEGVILLIGPGNRLH